MEIKIKADDGRGKGGGTGGWGWGGGVSSLAHIHDRTRDRKSRVRFPVGAAGKLSSPWSTSCADSYFGIPVFPEMEVAGYN